MNGFLPAKAHEIAGGIEAGAEGNSRRIRLSDMRPTERATAQLRPADCIDHSFVLCSLTPLYDPLRTFVVGGESELDLFSRRHDRYARS